MKCEVTKVTSKTCKTCGFKTDNMLITVCPRCMGSLPAPTSCSGGCSSCNTAHS